MLAKSLLLFFIGTVGIAIALLVLARDYRKPQNQLFFLFLVALCGWVIGIGGFLNSIHPHVAFVWAKVYYSFPLLVAVTMPLFSYTFPYNTTVPRRVWVPIILGYALLAIPLVASPTFVTAALTYHDWGKEIILNKSHYALYSVYLLSCLGYGLVHTYRKSRQARGTARAQLRFYFFGFLLTSFFGVLFNLILPWFGNYRLIWIGPIFTTAIVIAIAYSIIRHRMFDVRLVVARSIAYLASLGVIAAVYGFIVFGLVGLIFDLHFSLSLQVFLSIATGVAALAFPSLKTYFDRATRQLFYREAYDPQAFFDEFNKALASTIELDTLLRRATDIIALHLKAQYCLVGVKDNTEGGQRIIGTTQKKFIHKDINLARHITPNIMQVVLVTDDLPKEFEQLRRVLIKNDIAVLVRLTNDYKNQQEGIGYIVLGAKKSGNPYTNQDINVLEAVANELVIAIQNAMRFEEIEAFNITLQQKVDAATRQLRQNNEKLRKLDETKDDFISMASHQLRTPLTSVKGYVSMVLDGDAGKITPLQRKLLSQSFISSQRMVYLISDLLNVSRLRTGKFIIESVPTNLARMIQEEIEQLVETAKGRGLTLTYHKPEHFPTLMLDETKMRQVLMNFIDNAVYYTPSGGHIDVYLIDKPESIEFNVVDDGIGVPRQDQHRLFTKFFRAHNAKRARPDGTGLGLFMAKKVVVSQGGAVIFRSQEGKGSTFGFTFAKSKLAPPEAAKPSAAPAVRA
ncbi:MAG TPA: ATP-binding protein [Candidatus Saccharimonadales bacterium]|nr:ATP-binding protein [Candidatus Saccharimonadales bacterium]